MFNISIGLLLWHSVWRLDVQVAVVARNKAHDRMCNKGRVLTILYQVRRSRIYIAVFVCQYYLMSNSY